MIEEKSHPKFHSSKARPPAKPFTLFFPRNLHQIKNLLKVAGGLIYSLISRRVHVWGDPLIAHIEPTSLCNLNCPLCPAGAGLLSRYRTNLDFQKFKIILDKLPSSVRMLLLWNQGEPFLVKDLKKMIQYAKSRNIYVVTSTNGHFFRTEKSAIDLVNTYLDELIISLDGADQQTYEKYRVGGDLKIVFDGIERISTTKKILKRQNPLIHIQFIMMRHNLHQMEKITQIGRELGADKTSFKTVQLGDFKNGENFLPTDLKYTRYFKKDVSGKYTTARRRLFPNDCLRLWYSLVINCDGKVSPCCFDKDGEYAFGNLLDEPFHSIWYGKKFNDFRQQLLDSRHEFDMCKDCSEGLKSLFTRTIKY